MRLLIDEDTAVQLVEPLRRVLLGHEVAHISDLSWKGKKDLRVLPDAKVAGYHVLITRDHAQFSDPRECDAIKKSGDTAWPAVSLAHQQPGSRSR
jgi:predicted nuclease of predicted toxin-antitoxin system